jgi:hypothetical protein
VTDTLLLFLAVAAYAALGVGSVALGAALFAWLAADFDLARGPLPNERDTFLAPWRTEP